MHQVVVMCPHVVPCVSSYHLAPTKWTQNLSEALKRDQIRARTRQNHEESQGETGKKPQKHLRSCQNHSETIKKHEKASKTTPEALKSTPKALKREPEPSQRHRNTSSFLGKPTKGTQKGIQAVSQGSRSSRNTQNDSKTTQNLSKSPKTLQKAWITSKRAPKPLQNLSRRAPKPLKIQGLGVRSRGLHTRFRAKRSEVKKWIMDTQEQFREEKERKSKHKRILKQPVESPGGCPRKLLRYAQNLMSWPVSQPLENHQNPWSPKK